MLVMVTEPALLAVKVSGCSGLVVPSVTFPKAILPGAALSVGSVGGG